MVCEYVGPIGVNEGPNETERVQGNEKYTDPSGVCV